MPFPLLDPRPADAILLAQRGSDASDAVHLDEAADAIVRALMAVLYVEKLAVRERVVPARDVKACSPQVLPAEAAALCIPGADRFAA